MTKPNNSTSSSGWNQPALEALHQFVEIDPDTMRKPTDLIKNLGGISLAISSLAYDYAQVHCEPNIGIWTHIGEKDDVHSFVVTAQHPETFRGAELWRNDTEGGSAATYQDRVILPTDRALERFRATPLNQWLPGKGKGEPSFEDIHASYKRRNQGALTDETYYPFLNPLTRGPEDPRSAEEDAVGYTKVLVRLTETMLKVLES